MLGMFNFVQLCKGVLVKIIGLQKISIGSDIDKFRL